MGTGGSVDAQLREAASPDDTSWLAHLGASESTAVGAVAGPAGDASAFAAGSGSGAGPPPTVPPSPAGVSRARARAARLLWTLAVLATLLLAVVIRLKVFVDGRSLWIDEAMLALNLATRSYGELLVPLDDNQAAPLGFLLLMRAIVDLAGSSELVLRLLPLLAGLAVVPLAGAVTRRLAGPRAGLVALILAALMPSLVYYSSELKQYSTDACVAALLLWLTLRGRDRGWTRRSLAWLALAGALGTWFSHPAAFVLCGCGLLLGLDALLARRGRELGQLVAVGAAWLTSFWVHLQLGGRSLLANGELTAYWEAGSAFAPTALRSGEDVRVVVELLQGLCAQPFRSPYVRSFLTGERTAVLAGLVMLAGLVSLLRRQVRLGLLVAVPIAAALTASAWRVYPFQGRLLVFTTPLLLVLLGTGIDAIWRRGRLPGALLLAGLLAWPLFGTVEVLVDPAAREELRPCLATLAQEARPGDTVWVYYGALPAWDWYTHRGTGPELADLNVLRGRDRPERADAFIDELSALVGGGRTWVIGSHDTVAAFGDERLIARATLEGLGAHVKGIAARGAWLDLYEL